MWEKIDSDPSWRTQVSGVCARIQQCLHFLHRIRLFNVCKEWQQDHSFAMVSPTGLGTYQ